MSPLRGFRGKVHVLDDEEIELLNDLVKSRLIDPGMRRVRRHDPKTFNLVVGNPFDDLVVGPTVLIGNPIDVDAKNPRSWPDLLLSGNHVRPADCR
jgi:hypothetical protein